MDFTSDDTRLLIGVGVLAVVVVFGFIAMHYSGKPWFSVSSSYEPSHVTTIRDEKMLESIENDSKLMHDSVVFYHSNGCQWCKIALPEFEQASNIAADDIVRFYAVENRYIPMNHKFVKRVPMIAYFHSRHQHNGPVKPVFYEGPRTRHDIAKWIRQQRNKERIAH